MQMLQREQSMEQPISGLGLNLMRFISFYLFDVSPPNFLSGDYKYQRWLYYAVKKHDKQRCLE
jgi:hypothetical protein